MNQDKNLINKTKNKDLGKIKFADSFFSRFRGLMLVKNLDTGLVLKMPPGRGKRGSAIHMFFMRISLDVIFADENLQVVDMVTLNPWTTYTPQAPARYVIELPTTSLQKSETEIGDILEFR